ncbi:MAG: helix-turn-helix domain-containing protein [Candidatus Promineifilaceae bacterium]
MLTQLQQKQIHTLTTFDRQTDPNTASQQQNGNISLPVDARRSDSPFVERVWYSRSDVARPFVSVAESHWEIVITKYGRSTILTVRGPQTQATNAYCPPNREFIGIVFKVGVFMPKFPVKMVRNRQDLHLPQAGSNSFWLDSSAWEFPTFENADTFINRLVREELLVEDPIIEMALRGRPTPMSPRTIQRRFLQVTGLTQNSIFQIQRARYATNLLIRGVSILDTVEQAGYFDQPHMTRALSSLMGQTPGQIFTRNTNKPMSLLYKTPPF